MSKLVKGTLSVTVGEAAPLDAAAGPLDAREALPGFDATWGRIARPSPAKGDRIAWGGEAPAGAAAEDPAYGAAIATSAMTASITA